MFVANTGAMAMLFNEEGINSSGSLTKSIRRPNEMTAKRSRAVNTIVSLSRKNGVPVGTMVGKVLSQSIPELQSFVQARGESPSPNPVSLAVQAALLRATEIGLVSKTIDTDDDDALLLIEDSEQQHVDDNSGENSGILAADTAAGLALLVDRISERFKKNGGSGDLKDFVQTMKNSQGANNFDTLSYRYVADNATGDDAETAAWWANYMKTQSGTTPPASSSTSSFWDNLFGVVDRVVDGLVGKATDGIDKIITNAGGSVKDTVNDLGGGIGASSIEQYLANNWPKLLLGVIGLIVFTIIISRVSRSK